jgi:hypothetical protein
MRGGQAHAVPDRHQLVELAVDDDGGRGDRRQGAAGRPGGDRPQLVDDGSPRRRAFDDLSDQLGEAFRMACGEPGAQCGSHRARMYPSSGCLSRAEHIRRFVVLELVLG